MGHYVVQLKALNENDDGDKKKNNVYLKRERERWAGNSHLHSVSVMLKHMPSVQTAYTSTHTLQ